MSGVKNLMIAYAESRGIPVDDIDPSVTLTQMQDALTTGFTGNVLSLPVELSKATPPIPWVTLKSYVEVALQTTNLTGWTVAILEQSGLAITWEHCLIEVSVLIPSLSRAQQPLFQIKLFETQQWHEKPLAIEFKRQYSGMACACANLLNNVVMRRALNAMEAEWATESAATDADAEAMFERGKAIAEEQAQLEQEEKGF